VPANSECPVPVAGIDAPAPPAAGTRPVCNVVPLRQHASGSGIDDDMHAHWRAIGPRALEAHIPSQARRGVAHVDHQARILHGLDRTAKVRAGLCHRVVVRPLRNGVHLQGRRQRHARALERPSARMDDDVAAEYRQAAMQAVQAHVLRNRSSRRR
jgi:hypothetical protein